MHPISLLSRDLLRKVIVFWYRQRHEVSPNTLVSFQHASSVREDVHLSTVCVSGRCPSEATEKRGGVNEWLREPSLVGKEGWPSRAPSLGGPRRACPDIRPDRPTDRTGSPPGPFPTAPPNKSKTKTERGLSSDAAAAPGADSSSARRSLPARCAPAPPGFGAPVGTCKPPLSSYRPALRPATTGFLSGPLRRTLAPARGRLPRRQPDANGAPRGRRRLLTSSRPSLPERFP